MKDLQSEWVRGHNFDLFLERQDESTNDYIVHIFTFQPYREVQFFFVGGPGHEAVNALNALQEDTTAEQSTAARQIGRPELLDDDDDLAIIQRSNPRPAGLFDDDDDESD